MLWRKYKCEYRSLSFLLQFIEYFIDRSPFSSSSLRETSANARQGIDVTRVLSWDSVMLPKTRFKRGLVAFTRGILP